MVRCVFPSIIAVLSILGHRQAYLSGIIHRDISENNVMLTDSDDVMTAFVGFILDFDYSFDWQDILKRSGWEISEASWKMLHSAMNLGVSCLVFFDYSESMNWKELLRWAERTARRAGSRT